MRNIHYGIRNLFFFFRVVWKYREWDYSYSLALFRKGLIPLANCLERGQEIDEFRLPKVKNIKRTVEILDNIINDNYLSLAEKELGIEYNISYPIGEEPNNIRSSNGELSGYSNMLEDLEWNELMMILCNMRGWWD